MKGFTVVVLGVYDSLQPGGGGMPRTRKQEKLAAQRKVLRACPVTFHNIVTPLCNALHRCAS